MFFKFLIYFFLSCFSQELLLQGLGSSLKELSVGLKVSACSPGVSRFFFFFLGPGTRPVTAHDTHTIASVLESLFSANHTPGKYDIQEFSLFLFFFFNILWKKNQIKVSCCDFQLQTFSRFLFKFKKKKKKFISGQKMWLFLKYF